VFKRPLKTGRTMTAAVEGRGRTHVGDRTLRVAALVPAPEGTAGSQRYRWESWGPLLREYGIEVEFVSFADRALDQSMRRGDSRDILIHAARRYLPWLRRAQVAVAASDLVVVQRKAAVAGPPVGELLAAAQKPLIFDLDDAIWLAPEDDDPWLRRLARCDWRVGPVARAATTVSAGSPYLVEHMRRYNDDVVRWPTTVSLDDYQLRAARVGDAERLPVVGWTGSRSTAKYLERVLPLLREVAAEVEFELLVMGAALDLDGFRHRLVEWSPEVEVPTVQQMDIGIMPLTDDAWSRGKCGMKAIQYLAVGTPAVVEDVGVNAEVVPHEECGYVVSSPEQWKRALLQLLRNSSLRERMGACGRARVESHYSAQAWVPRIAEKLWSLASHRRVR